MRPPLIPLFAVAMLLSACDTSPLPEPQVQASAKPAAVSEATEMRDAIQQPIDKAGAVEDATLKAAEDQRKQIEDAGG